MGMSDDDHVRPQRGSVQRKIPCLCHRLRGRRRYVVDLFRTSTHESTLHTGVVILWMRRIRNFISFKKVVRHLGGSCLRANRLPERVGQFSTAGAGMVRMIDQAVEVFPDSLGIVVVDHADTGRTAIIRITSADVSLDINVAAALQKMARDNAQEPLVTLLNKQQDGACGRLRNSSRAEFDLLVRDRREVGLIKIPAWGNEAASHREEISMAEDPCVSIVALSM